MSQPYNRVFNFSAGPCTLPVEVLEEISKDLFNFKGSGVSVMEMSHRDKPFEKILAEAEADLRTLMGIPDDYRVLFLQGGASLQFMMAPGAFLHPGKTAQYVVTGAWGKKALASAKMIGDVEVLFDGKSGGYSDVPDWGGLNTKADAAYIHFTTNETIEGPQFKSDPTLPAPIICDMSSDILSRPVDVSKYAMIYAGAQKNMGPAGATVVIIRDDFLATQRDGLQPMLDYKVFNENSSMYNTPPCWSIYVAGLVYKHVLAQGGLSAQATRNQKKADTIYIAIDGSAGFYKGHAATHCRSTMNVTFTLPSEDMTKAFLVEAAAKQLDSLKGHRSVGGLRASIYNAFPQEGADALAALMEDFAARNR